MTVVVVSAIHVLAALHTQVALEDGLRNHGSSLAQDPLLHSSMALMRRLLTDAQVRPSYTSIFIFKTHIQLLSYDHLIATDNFTVSYIILFMENVL